MKKFTTSYSLVKLRNNPMEFARIISCACYGFKFRKCNVLDIYLILPLILYESGIKKLENANVKSSIQSIYLRDKSLYPIQLAVRNLLEEETALKGDSVMTRYAQLMKYALIGVVSTPIVVLYPFLQKYFEKGVMMGSVKS